MMKDWRFFFGDGKTHDNVKIEELPPPPPWRRFRDIKKMTQQEQEEIKERWSAIQKLAESEENERGKNKGSKFLLYTNEEQNEIESLTEEGKEVINAVNSALYLRRPLLVTGNPGTGKTSLAYAIAHELKLGTVLTWSITARTTLQDGLYRYDAIGRLQDAEQGEETNLGNYIQLGPIGTAFLPSELPRVLLIDEIDKSDINLPNDLLHLFEEGAFEIPELVRRVKKSTPEKDNEDGNRVEVGTADLGIKASIYRGRVRCAAFPIVMMTSNGEREFPPAFLRRCLRVKMPDPQAEALIAIVKAHFQQDGESNGEDGERWKKLETQIEPLIAEFLSESDRATDQLLNTIYLLTNHISPEASDAEALKALLLKRLSISDQL